MTSYEVKLGTACNNCCIFCLNGEANWNKSTKDVMQEILNAKSLGINTVQFTGGEPTIREDFLNILKYTKSLGLKIKIQTNGRSFSYPDYARKMCDIGIDSFLVSLHAHNKELNHKLTRVEGGFRQTVEGIRNLVRLGQNVSINCVINKYNICFLKEIAKHHSNIGVESLQFGWVTPKGRAKENFDLIVPKVKDNIKYLYHALDYLKNNYVGYVCVLGLPFCMLGEYSKFKAMEYSDVASIDGRNLEKVQFNNILQKKMKNEKCKNCSKNKICEGIFEEYYNKFGDEEIKPIEYENEKKFLAFVVPSLIFRKDNVCYNGAYVVTKNIIGELSKSKAIEESHLFVPDYRYSLVESEDQHTKIFPFECIKEKIEEYDYEIIYFIWRDKVTEIIDNSIKKAILIHSQDGSDLIESYKRIIQQKAIKNLFWISPSNSGKEVFCKIAGCFNGNKTFSNSVRVIPWGISDMKSYDKDFVKKKYGLKKNVLLYFGRINQIYKADLIPFIKGIKGSLDKDTSLVISGNVEDRNLVNQIKDMGDLRESIKIIENPDEKTKEELFSSADIFISPVDNIQETFGISLLEAMYYGLPIICSDWGGYRDLIKNGENGFRVKTISYFPDSKLLVGAENVSENLMKNAAFCSQLTAVDFNETRDKISMILNDKRLKESIKKNNLNEANGYMWSNIIKRHEEMWDENEEMEIKTYIMNKDLRIDDIFKDYPTYTLFKKNEHFSILENNFDNVAKIKETYVRFKGLYENLDAEIIKHIIANNIVDSNELIKKFGESAKITLAWMTKQNFIRLIK